MIVKNAKGETVRLTKVDNVRMGDLIELENNGCYWTFRIETGGVDWWLVPISEEERRTYK